MVSFNSQPRKGADRNSASDTSDTVVSTHSPARGLTETRDSLYTRYLRFNSQPRKGADFVIGQRWDCTDVSTHSPARGLTRNRSMSYYRIFVSTHSPARGLTRNRPTRCWSGLRFNSQPRKGADSRRMRQAKR